MYEDVFKFKDEITKSITKLTFMPAHVVFVYIINLLSMFLLFVRSRFFFILISVLHR